MIRSTIRRRAVAAAAVATLVAAPAAALAATKNGVTPQSPKAGAKVPKGKAVTFTGKVTGTGEVFVYVCKSAKRATKDGRICSKETFLQAKVKKGTFTAVQKFYDYPDSWLNVPGTYYWQAYQVRCATPKDCRQEGPATQIKVG